MPLQAMQHSGQAMLVCLTSSDLAPRQVDRGLVLGAPHPLLHKHFPWYSAMAVTVPRNIGNGEGEAVESDIYGVVAM
jgi:hypothetical protein